MTIREALLAMGYQEAQPGRWMKPVGWHTFAYDEETLTWVNVCRLGDGEVGVYEKHTFIEKETPLRQLKDWEAYTRVNVAASMPSVSDPDGSELHISRVIDYKDIL